MQTQKRKKAIPQQTTNLARRKHQRETKGTSKRKATKFTQKYIPRKHTREKSKKTQKYNVKPNTTCDINRHKDDPHNSCKTKKEMKKEKKEAKRKTHERRRLRAKNFNDRIIL
jgi:hypothetical protein